MTVGRKDDLGKDRWDLFPWAAAQQVVKVLGFGAKRYGENNWQKVTNAHRRYFAAVMRHMTAWWEGEEIDPDSGLSHLAHAACSMLFLLSLRARRPLETANQLVERLGFSKPSRDEEEINLEESFPVWSAQVERRVSAVDERQGQDAREQQDSANLGDLGIGRQGVHESADDGKQDGQPK